LEADAGNKRTIAGADRTIAGNALALQAARFTLHAIQPKAKSKYSCTLHAEYRSPFSSLIKIFFMSEQSVVCYGEILWDVLPSGSLPGGAPMNVAYHLHKLNCNPALITSVGSDRYGTGLMELLSQWGIATDHVSINKYHPTGIVYAQPSGPHEMTYDIVYPSAWDFIHWEEKLTDLVQAADYLVFGSLACRNYTSANTLFKLLESATTKVLDINIRPPHFSPRVVEQLLQKADILKLNLAELALVAGWYSAAATITDKMQLLQDRFQLNTVVVTMGEDGAMLNMDGMVYQHPGYRVQVADTVGSGDAFLAALLSKLMEKASPEVMLDFACAMGAHIASYAGACPDYSTQEIKVGRLWKAAHLLKRIT
jgi:fructokinase